MSLRKRDLNQVFSDFSDMEKIKFKFKIQFFEMVGNIFIISIFYFELFLIYEFVLKEIEMEMQKFLLIIIERVE